MERPGYLVDYLYERFPTQPCKVMARGERFFFLPGGRCRIEPDLRMRPVRDARTGNENATREPHTSIVPKSRKVSGMSDSVEAASVAGAFATIGEILVDFTPLVDRGATVGFRMHPGGSPRNVAVGLARCGARVEFVGAVSTDFFGRFLVAQLEREGVGTRLLVRSAAPSTLAFVATERDGPSFTFYRTGAADTQLATADVPPAVDESDVLHFGSISLLTASTRETVLALADRLHGRRLLSFDPNIRPSLIDDPDGYRRMFARAARAADVVKLSEADLAWWMPGVAVAEGADRLRALGPALVVVTLGGRGCYARAPRREMRVPAPQVEVVDTIGAGDAFSSGLLLRLWERGLGSRRALERADAETLEDALRFAAAAAALACTKAGADPPRRDEIEQLLGPGVGHAAH